jgi:hypothetical protein
LGYRAPVCSRVSRLHQLTISANRASASRECLGVGVRFAPPCWGFRSSRFCACWRRHEQYFATN